MYGHSRSSFRVEHCATLPAWGHVLVSERGRLPRACCDLSVAEVPRVMSFLRGRTTANRLRQVVWLQGKGFGIQVLSPGASSSVPWRP